MFVMQMSLVWFEAGKSSGTHIEKLFDPVLETKLHWTHLQLSSHTLILFELQLSNVKLEQ